MLFRDLDDPDAKHTSGVLRALFEFIRIIINLSVYLILLVGTLVLSGNSRKRELEADRFAFELGYGEELKTALYLLQKLSLSSNTSLIEKMKEGHPRVSKRIAILESLLDE